MKPRQLALMAPLLFAACQQDGIKVNNADTAVPTDPVLTETTTTPGTTTTTTETTTPTVDLSCAEFTDEFNTCIGAACDGLWGTQEAVCLDAVDDCTEQLLGDEVLDCCVELDDCLDGYDSKGEQYECIAKNPIDIEGECCAVQDWAFDLGVTPADTESSYGFAIPDICVE